MKKIIFTFFLVVNFAIGADLESLETLFHNNFNSIYKPRFCGQNIKNFVKLALDQKINLENSYILKVSGLGFLETSGFYTRNSPNTRKNLGYFHFVLIADNHAFDFDLHEPLVLDFKDYVNLQFLPKTEDQNIIFGINYIKTGNPKSWQALLYKIESFLSNNPEPFWQGKLSELY